MKECVLASVRAIVGACKLACSVASVRAYERACFYELVLVRCLSVRK
jgi:hypothetical protein